MRTAGRPGLTGGCAANAGPATGFSLTEMLIVVTIIGIIAAFALPNFTRQMQNTRRTDAVDSLIQVAAEQEKFYIDNNSYAADLAELGFASGKSGNGYYTLTLTADDETFTATAKPVSDGPQAEDKTCAEFTLTQEGQRSAESQDGDDTTVDCWQ